MSASLGFVQLTLIIPMRLTRFTGIILVDKHHSALGAACIETLI